MVAAMALSFQAPVSDVPCHCMMDGMLLPSLFLVGVASALTCDAYLPFELLGELKGTAVVEASGLARSRTRPGIWFTHNDAGGLAEIYAFELDGTFVETHFVVGGDFVDWEDMAAGPCPGSDGHCLYIGDTGDNSRTRSSIVVYVVQEPAAGEPATVIATFPAFYPEGVQEDSEALFVHPRTGDIYLATKDYESTVSHIYRFHHEPTDSPQELELVHDWEMKPGEAATTGGAWDSDGDRLVIRTYGAAHEWLTDPCAPDAHWGGETVVTPIGDFRGESIAYDTDGGMITVTEGDPMMINLAACAKPGPGSGPCDTGEADTDTDTDTDTDSDSDADTDSLPLDSDPIASDEPGDSADGSEPGDCGGCGGCGHAPVGGLMAMLVGLAALRRRRTR